MAGGYFAAALFLSLLFLPFARRASSSPYRHNSLCGTLLSIRSALAQDGVRGRLALSGSKSCPIASMPIPEEKSELNLRSIDNLRILEFAQESAQRPLLRVFA